MAFQDSGDYLLNTQEARKAFCDEYKGQLYNIAINLTHNQKQAYNLVVGAFQHAFLKYASTPCPDNCMPFLSSAVYLLYANGNETSDVCSNTANSKFEPDERAQPTSQYYTDRSTRQPKKPPVAEYVSVQEDDSDETEAAAEVVTKTTIEEPAPAEPETSSPRHAQEQQDSSQPLSRQVFDPEHTDYWTPSMEKSQPPTPEPNKRHVPDSSLSANEQTSPGAGAAAEDPIQQPNFSQAYMYDAKIAKKKKSASLRVINTLLFFLLVWMSIGLLIRMEVLPQWNLGYAWFNLYIFPLF